MGFFFRKHKYSKEARTQIKRCIDNLKNDDKKQLNDLTIPAMRKNLIYRLQEFYPDHLFRALRELISDDPKELNDASSYLKDAATLVKQSNIKEATKKVDMAIKDLKKLLK